MIKRKKLGQHFLKSDHLAKLNVDSLKITSNDILYEKATAKGI